jgi:hypothetical protein
MTEFRHDITIIVAGGGRQVKTTRSYSADGGTSRSWSVPDESTDLQCNIAIDVDKVKSFVIVSDQDVTIVTNDGTTPDDTLTLEAGIEYRWDEDSLDDFKLTADVTAMYITNASGAAATVDVDVIQDTTPA